MQNLSISFIWFRTRLRTSRRYASKGQEHLTARGSKVARCAAPPAERCAQLMHTLFGVLVYVLQRCFEVSGVGSKLLKEVKRKQAQINAYASSLAATKSQPLVKDVSGSPANSLSPASTKTQPEVRCTSVSSDACFGLLIPMFLCYPLLSKTEQSGTSMPVQGSAPYTSACVAIVPTDHAQLLTCVCVCGCVLLLRLQVAKEQQAEPCVDTDADILCAKVAAKAQDMCDSATESDNTE